MDKFILYTQNDIETLVNKRNGETKLGEKVKVISDLSELNTSPAQFVLIGIPEDIGVSANLGIAGTKTAWKSALKTLLNIQSNVFLTGTELLILGEFAIEEPIDTTLNGLRNKVVDIDRLVVPIIEKVIAAGKTPIVIGGGHNNAAPLIEGTAKGLKTPINVINIDAHADLRNLEEGRHSGNGFTYAFQHGYLSNYRIFGLHQNYVNAELAKQLQDNKSTKACYFEDILFNPNDIVTQWKNFIDDLPEPLGLEIDLDSIAQILSSASSPTGFVLNDIRKIIAANHKKFSYLHICEGAIELIDGRKDNSTSKAITYLLTDFIKALRLRI